MKVWFVIPAYNEGRVLGEVVESVVSHGYQVVVVDDCSGDDTADTSLRSGAYVCRHSINLGQGAAIQTGIEFAIQQGADAIVTFDADGQHSVHDAQRMIERLAKGDVDVVLGSRFAGATVGMTKGKQLLLKAATIYTRYSSGLSVTDTHNGLRCFASAAAAKLRIRHNRMAHASEILDKIGSLQMRYVELPCTITYTSYSRAKGQRMRGAFTILADLALGRLHK
ncbi:MAG: glycosyltransferase family 2 protein [Rhizobium rhizophilum]|uniref:glycosyltransferase family 2 protein n=1 Tax=Rhizobium rhizophilum TaxID=1850373 RepID=UPI00391A0535